MWDDEFEQLLRQQLPFLAADEVLDEDADLRDLGLDSMAMVELLGALEHAYRVRFHDDVLSVATFRTPAVLWGELSRTLQPTG
jgi:acyl carrier protein